MAVKGGELDVSVTGYKELDKMFADLPTKLTNKALRLATRESAQVVRDVAAARAPRDTGTMASQLKVRSVARRRRGTIGHSVVIDWEAAKNKAIKKSMDFSAAFYGQFIEFGWDDDPEGQPFMRPALYDNADRFEAITKQRTLAHINSLRAVVAASQPLTGSELARTVAKNMRAAWKQEREALSTSIIDDNSDNL